MKFVPYDQLNGGRFAIVDGPKHEGAALVLSHWPGTGTSPVLRDDLSAQIVFRYLDRPWLHVPLDAVSNNHFDEDGLVAIWALLNPEAAGRRRERLIDVAGAGDFGIYRSRDAARISYTLAAFGHPALSPLHLNVAGLPYDEWVATMFDEMLGRLPEIIDHPDRFRRLWDVEDARLDATESALARGEITVEEVPHLDLAVINLPEDWCDPRSLRSRESRVVSIRSTGLYNSTRCSRLLFIQGARFELEFRFESWVHMRSRRPLPRIDLAPLAERLSDQEPGQAKWVFDGIARLTPRLRLADSGASHIDPLDFRTQVESFLVDAPPAWDPYLEDLSTIPGGHL